MYRLILFLVLLLPIGVSGQRLIFCEKVDQSGNEINPASLFYIDAKGGFFTALVKAGENLTVDEVVYDLYLIDEKTGKEIFNSSIRMKVSRGVSWFYKEITFYKSGTYHVYVYDTMDKLLAVGKVNVAFR